MLKRDIERVMQRYEDYLYIKDYKDYTNYICINIYII
jgi:hypothetical protein